MELSLKIELAFYLYESLIIIADSLPNDYANIARIENCKTIAILRTRWLCIVRRVHSSRKWSQRHEMASLQNNASPPFERNRSYFRANSPKRVAKRSSRHATATRRDEMHNTATSGHARSAPPLATPRQPTDRAGCSTRKP